MPELTEADHPQLDRSERRTPPAADAAPARRLPGAARAQAFTEPAADTAPPPRERAVTAVTAVTAAAPVEPSAGSLWDRFEQPTGAATTDGPVAGWTPPAPTEAPAEWGRRPAVVKVLSFGLATAKPGREELDHRHNVRTIRAATWPRSARIAVANPKGGSGKTPTAVILGGILASIRGGSVAIWDAADAAGTLAGRTEGFAARCVSDIEAEPELYSLPSTVGMVAATQSSFADVLGSLRERAFVAASVWGVSSVLDRTYRISIADTGNVPHSSAFEAVIERADILVVPTILTADSVNKAVGLLRRLQDTPTGLVQRAVVAVLHTRGPETPDLAGQVEGIFGAAGVGAVVDIPFDPHIAAGTAITLAGLHHESRVAWTRLAAATVANLTVRDRASYR